MEFAQLSVRANVDYAFVSGGFPLQDTWQLLLPGVLTQYSPLYIGVIGLGLAVLGVADAGRGARGEGRGTSSPSGRFEFGYRPVLASRTGILFFLIVAFLALLLSFGDNGFLYPLFYRFAPGWSLFRGQERVAYLVAFGLSILAGYGAAAITATPQRRRARLATLYAGIVIAAAYVFGVLWQLPGHTAIGEWHYLVIAAITMSLAATFAVMLRLPGWSRRRSVLLTVLAVGNLFAANFATNLDPFSPTRKAILSPEVEALQAAVAETATGNLGLPGRVYNEYRAYEDYGIRAGVEDVWGSSPLRLSRYAALFDQFPLDRMWRLMGVDHVLTWRRDLFEPSTRLAEFPQATDTTYLHRLDEPNPRAWLVSNVRTATDQEAVALLADHTFDLEATALLPVDESAIPQSAQVESQTTAAPVHSTVRLERLAPNRLRVQANSEQAGLLVISENWMPGWRVMQISCGDVDAACTTEASPVQGAALFTPVRADLTLIGVPVPAGPVQFDLVYWPDSVRFGLWISGGTLLILLVLAIWQVARKKMRPINSL